MPGVREPEPPAPGTPGLGLRLHPSRHACAAAFSFAASPGATADRPRHALLEGSVPRARAGRPPCGPSRRRSAAGLALQALLERVGAGLQPLRLTGLGRGLELGGVAAALARRPCGGRARGQDEGERRNPRGPQSEWRASELLLGRTVRVSEPIGTVVHALDARLRDLRSHRIGPRWRVPSRCSPASGPTCRWRSSPRKAATGASTASSSPAGATTSRSTGRSPTPGYVRATAGAARAARPGVLRDRRPPRRPGGLRPDRRAPPGDPAARGLGRRRAGGRPRARRRADEGHGAGRGAARRDAGQRLHRLVDLAPALLVPAERLRRDRARLRATSPSAGTRSSTCSTRRACASGSRCTRPRSPTTS